MKQIAGKAVKKPVEINWFRWGGFSKPHSLELIQWVQSFNVDFLEHFQLDTEGGTLMVNTSAGSVNVPKGYPILYNGKEFYPCDPEIFNDTYDIINEN